MSLGLNDNESGLTQTQISSKKYTVKWNQTMGEIVLAIPKVHWTSTRRQAWEGRLSGGDQLGA